MYKIETGVKIQKRSDGQKTGPRTKLNKTIAALKENQSFFVAIPNSKSKKAFFANVRTNATKMKERGIINFKIKTRSEINDEGRAGIRVFHEKQRA